MLDNINKNLDALAVYQDLPVSRLVEEALFRGEGFLTSQGSLSVNTGKYTGRSPNDKFTVKETNTQDKIRWGDVNRPISQDKFDILLDEILKYLKDKEIFVFNGFACVDEKYRFPVKFINELSWHNMFVQQLFLEDETKETDNYEPEFTIISAPGYKADPEIHGTNSEAFIILNFDKKVGLIGGTYYAGEMKKSVFTIMNYILPQRDVMPMHCSANMGENGDTALFFGLSGTGKTTLSADPERKLIGDDQHGWSENGTFNIEGGLYAKCINLSPQDEPQIWEAIRFGSVIENVVIDPLTREVDFDSNKITENTRAGFPVDFIPGAVIPGIGGHPEVIIFLTADAFGVLPPVARLTTEQAMYHFLSGYTSKLAGTERGIIEPQATFSTCFAAPFLPLHPKVYAEQLGEKINKYNSKVYLINTGWIGGPYGVGRRISISYTRNIVRAVTSGKIEEANFNLHPIFNMMVPESCPEVPDEILDPRNTWEGKDKYDDEAEKLAKSFVENFQKFEDLSPELAKGGPQVRTSAHSN